MVSWPVEAEDEPMNATDETSPPPPPPPPPGSDPHHRLTRSTDDKVLTGLCGGLGRYFGLDPLIFRVAFVVLALAGGTGVLLYLVGWLLIPDDQGGVAVGLRGDRPRTRKFLMAVLIAAGVVILVGDVFDRHRGPDLPLTVALLAVGAAVLWSRRDRLGGPPAPPAPPAWPSGPATPGPTTGGTAGGGDAATSPLPTPPPAGPPTDAPTPPSPADTTSGDDAGSASAPTVPFVPPSSVFPAPPVPPPPTSAAGGAWTPSVSTRIPPPTRAPRQPRPRSVLVPATLSLLAAVAGLLALLRAPLAVVLAVLLLLTGGAMVVGAWRGRARWLIPVAIVLGVALAAASVLDVPIKGESGDRTFRPTTLTDLRPTYRVAVGQLVLDLRDLDLGGRTVSVLATDAIGHLQVLVPRTATVVATGHAGAGDVTLFGQSWDGTHVDKTRTSPGPEGGGRIELTARVGIGQVEVLRAEA
jgi:phage shock protein PspC (stress-responsive transcriptional regulator)